jgi:hypothetical protein
LKKESSDVASPAKEEVCLMTLKMYMCAIQNLKMTWMTTGKFKVTKKEVSLIHQKYLRFHQNRKDQVMRQKSKFYSTLNEQREMYGKEPTFQPKINKRKTDSKGGNRVNEIIEKGKLYQQRKYDATRLKDLEQLGDPELTFKPKINQKKPPRTGTANASHADMPTWQKLHKQSEQYWRRKFDRELDAIEWSKEPDEFTFKPEILGDKRSGKQMPLVAETLAEKRK